MKQIKIPIASDWNFTPASLMNYYARQTPGTTFYRSPFGNARLLLNGSAYQYHHWSITANHGSTIVTLFLERVPS